MIREWVEYVASRAVEASFSGLPVRAGEAVGVAVGRAARAVGVRREVARRQVAASFPDRGPDWVEGVVEASYRHFGREAAALARLSRLDPELLAAGVAGTDRLREHLAGAGHPGGGRIIVTGHLGNWELGGAVVAGLGPSVLAVVKPQANRRFDRRIEALRRRIGIEPIPMAEAGRRLPDALTAGAVVALVADQDAGGRGVFVPFLGRPASTFRGPARLALSTGARLLFAALVREPGRGYRLEVEPVEVGAAEAVDGRAGGRGAGEREAELELTRGWVACLEASVRAHPEQYFWFHRRWKTAPGERHGPTGTG